MLARLVAHNPGVDHPCCLFLWSHLDTAHVGPEESVPLSSWPDPLVHLKKGRIELKHLLVHIVWFNLLFEKRTCRNTSVSDDISSNTDMESMVCSHLNGM